VLSVNRVSEQCYNVSEHVLDDVNKYNRCDKNLYDAPDECCKNKIRTFKRRIQNRDRTINRLKQKVDKLKEAKNNTIDHRNIKTDIDAMVKLIRIQNLEIDTKVIVNAYLKKN